jgi:hypothetical protein
VRSNKREEYTHRILVAQGGDYHIGLYTQQDAKPTYKKFVHALPSSSATRCPYSPTCLCCIVLRNIYVRQVRCMPYPLALRLVDLAPLTCPCMSDASYWTLRCKIFLKLLQTNNWQIGEECFINETHIITCLLLLLPKMQVQYYYTYLL